MNIADLRKLKWKSIDDWTFLPVTHFDNNEQSYVSKSDVENFISNYIHDIARKYNLTYDELNKLITEENKAFFSILDSLYVQYTGLGTGSAELKTLKKNFKAPCFPAKESDPVEELLISFDLLTDIQKAEILSKLKLFNIKIVDKTI